MYIPVYETINSRELFITNSIGSPMSCYTGNIQVIARVPFLTIGLGMKNILIYIYKLYVIQVPERVYIVTFAA